MKKTKNTNAGITLITLVITIIVLLILAGVALSALTGDSGILSNSEKAKKQTNLANSKEQVKFAVTAAMTYPDALGTITYSNLDEELENIAGADKYTINPEEDADSWIVKSGDYETIVYANGKILEKPEKAGTRFYDDETITIAGEPVSMLAGFTLSGATGECEEVDNGVVAYLIPEGTTVDWTDEAKVLEAQETYDQFVWVPVPKEDVITVDMDDDGDIDTTDIDEMIAEERFPMAIQTGTNADTGEAVYRAVLYDFSLSDDGTKVIVSDISYKAKSGYWEPGYLTKSKADISTTYNNVGIGTNTLQEAFDIMITKVKSNGGFWVGRYETSNMVKGTTENTAANDETNKITVIKGTTTGIADTVSTEDGTGLNWYRMYAQQKNYVNVYSEIYDIETTRTSSMIWGSQWDQIMIWMRKVANDKNTVNTNTFYVINAIGMGNYSIKADGEYKNIAEQAVAVTGSTTDYEVKNIYDLAGNVDDWTLEASSTYFRNSCGGNYRLASTSFAGAGKRSGGRYPRYSNDSLGSRATLY